MVQDVGARKDEKAMGAVPQVNSAEMREQKIEADREVKSDEQSLEKSMQKSRLKQLPH